MDLSDRRPEKTKQQRTPLFLFFAEYYYDYKIKEVRQVCGSITLK